MTIAFTPIPTDAARALQAGGPDAYGQAAERRVSDGDGVPCRHCLRQVPAGADYLVLAYRPFPALQPYAETGPIFLCADPAACKPPEPKDGLPDMLDSPGYSLRGYGPDDRIVSGTGGVVPTETIPARAEALLARPEVAYVHLRSASNTCFQARIDRG